MAVEIIRQCKAARCADESVISITWPAVLRKVEIEFELLKSQHQIPHDAPSRNKDAVTKKWRELLKIFHSQTSPTGQSRVLQAHQFLMSHADLVEFYFAPVRANGDDIDVGDVAGLDSGGAEETKLSHGILFPDGVPSSLHDSVSGNAFDQDGEVDPHTNIDDEDMAEEYADAHESSDVEVVHEAFPDVDAPVRVKHEPVNRVRSMSSTPKVKPRSTMDAPTPVTPTPMTPSPTTPSRTLRTGVRGQNQTQATRGKINTVIGSLSEEIKSSNKIIADFMSQPRPEKTTGFSETTINLIIHQIQSMQTELAALRTEVHSMQLQLARMPHTTQQPAFPFNQSSLSSSFSAMHIPLSSAMSSSSQPYFTPPSAFQDIQID
eukprot:TRINITY_DN12895_c0_g1_i3.p1 TRINITY_DN12895_c0_g1~~TRINITY_DN12895_c0_g1_i3.p1  ORF type:complete len:377 (+),score=13.72 TRINITY_DN12895_c0_g1_i3:165-1295(+)